MQQIEALFEATLAELLSYQPGVDLSELRTAYEVAKEAHSGQQRKTGEPFMLHPVETTRIIVDLLRKAADSKILQAALLHDTVEDKEEMTVAEIERRFGSEVATLVDGVTKISDLPFRSPENTQVETYRKMLLSMAKDIRVILVKLADRLHNMRTLEALPEHKRIRIAKETRDIYAPIAHRLGIAQIKWELEDLAFKHLDPENYRKLVRAISEKRTVREKAIEEVKEPIKRQLELQGIDAEIYGRPKHLWSILQKMQRLEAPFEEIFDLLGIRILTSSRADCYIVLGIVHDMFTPVADRLRDYIASPKSNMYQSLHTTVTDAKGERMVEIQIRTREMHRISEIGIAAHYSYKEGQTGPDREIHEKLGEFIVQGATEWQDESGDPGDFMDFLRTSLFQDEIFVFTPRGGLKRLPRGSTPVDFAFAIHSDVGFRTVGAKVDGAIVPLRYQLKSGQVVEVITSPHSNPSENWLGYVRSSRAKAKIRRYLAQERVEESVKLGREMLGRELKRQRKAIPKDKELEDVSLSFGLADVPLLFAKIGEGDISVQSVFSRIYPETKDQNKKVKSALDRIKNLAQRQVKGIHIGEIDGLLIRIAQCCNPIPGDKVIGLITKGRGISVHRIDCPNTFADRIDPERRIEVDWDVDREQRFPIRLVVIGGDRRGLLVDVAAVINRLGTDTTHAEMSLMGDGSVRGEFVVSVKNIKHLGKIVQAIKRINGVKRVDRAESIGPLEGE
jgi:GTP diphosphokinase / guanosine-3',5'-bis(diphosphate) 3'-diphosphatase